MFFIDAEKPRRRACFGPATYRRVILLVSSVILTTFFIFPTLQWNSQLGIAFYRDKSSLNTDKQDPASHWQDNIFPFRDQTPWDISTDYSYPRILEYEVQEGTWLRLDVHPRSGDIVFDMLGDLYCITGAEAYPNIENDIGKEFTEDAGMLARARPILLGIPHDSDPRFSPEGDRLAFRSDAELGVENVWIMPWTSCAEMDIRPTAEGGSRILQEALSRQRYEEELLTKGIRETVKRRVNRLVREGRLEAQRVTNETFRYVSGPRFHPSGTKIITSKWYTGRITIGASEGWEYPVPDLSVRQEPGSIKIGSGRRVLGRTLPRGMTVDDYSEQQIGPEQFIWAGEDQLIFAKNVVDEYITSEKDVHKGAMAIFSFNVTTGQQATLVEAFPGGASRPELSRDGRTLAFVRRVRDHEVLVLKDLQSGTLNYAWDGLTYDFSSSAPGPGGPYPSFAFSPDDTSIFIWAAGQIYRVLLTVNESGEKVAVGKPKPIRFKARVEKRLGEVLKSRVDLVGIEIQDTQRVHAFKELSLDDTGSRAVFQAAGVSVVQVFGSGTAVKVPVLMQDFPYYSPSFVPGSHHLVVHARWSDTHFTTFELADMESGIAYEIMGIPLGRYFTPVVSESSGPSRRIAFVKSAGDLLTGTTVATAKAGIYVGDIDLPSGLSSSGVSDTVRTITVKHLQHIPLKVDHSGRIVLRFLSNSRILVEEHDRVLTIELAAGADSLGNYTHHTVATGRMSNEIAIHSRSESQHVESVAFVEYQHVYLANGTYVSENEALWARPGNATKGLARASVHGSHDIAWSRDGKRLFWFLGPRLHSLEVSKVGQCASAITSDDDSFGVKCVSELVEHDEVFVEHTTDIARLKRDAKFAARTRGAQIDEGLDVIAICNATLLTMETSSQAKSLVSDGTMIVRGGLIAEIGTRAQITIPEGATIIDARGGFVIPGFIDIHAHWSGYTVRYPAASWEMQAFLAYGVTTMHNPSSDTVNTFVERSRLESGQFIGPRILTTGTVLFSGTWVGLHEEIVDMDQARAALYRIKAEGGPVGLSYKNYQLPSRASRQRLFKVAQTLRMLCVPEGGANYDWDMTYIVDGMTTVEHSLPIAVLYDDVLNLFALSGTGYTPTHLVNYGGGWGEDYVWAHNDLPNDRKLREFLPHDVLEGLSESVARPLNSYALFNASISAAQMARMGLSLHIGAHGEPPMGYNYHAEMSFAQKGGLSNYEVLIAATSSAARTLGIFESVGSLTPGKLADFLIYHTDADLLDGDMSETAKIRYVSRGGRIWNASDMMEVWPLEGRKQSMPPLNPAGS